MATLDYQRVPQLSLLLNLIFTTVSGIWAQFPRGVTFSHFPHGSERIRPWPCFMSFQGEVNGWIPGVAKDHEPRGPLEARDIPFVRLVHQDHYRPKFE